MLTPVNTFRPVLYKGELIKYLRSNKHFLLQTPRNIGRPVLYKNVVNTE